MPPSWRFVKNENEELPKHEETRTQMGLLQPLIEGVKRQSEAAVRKPENDKDVKVAIGDTAIHHGRHLPTMLWGSEVETGQV